MQNLPSIASTAIAGLPSVGQSWMDSTKAWVRDARSNQIETEDSSPTHLCHYHTNVSLTGDMTAPVPPTIVTRAALLFLVHNLDEAKLQACYDAVARIWTGDAGTDVWIEPATPVCVSPKSMAALEVVQPCFLDD